MKEWSKEESQRYVEKFRGYRGDIRCKRCGWFRYKAQHFRKEEVEAERKLRGEWHENMWEPLRYRVMVCEEERKAAYSVRREVQQGVKCWECGEVGHCLWTCPKKAVCPVQGKVQQEDKGKTICRR